MSHIINPFSRLGFQHGAGLDYVINAITGGSSSSSSSSGAETSVTVDQIVNATVDYINTIYGTGGGAIPIPINPTSLSPVSDLELSIIIQDAMNGISMPKQVVDSIMPASRSFSFFNYWREYTLRQPLG